MIVVNTDYISGKNLETLGMVFASTVQTKNMFKDIGAGLKNLLGGELGSYTKMMDEAKEIAINRMVEKARSMGADGIVNVRFSTSSITPGSTEVAASGTAVKFIN